MLRKATKEAQRGLKALEYKSKQRRNLLDFTSVNTPSDLVTQNEEVKSPTQVAAEAVLALTASQAQEVLEVALTALRNFHAETAHEAVANGEDNWFLWSRDAQKLDTALTLLQSVDLG
jgi:hypothetical protein